MEPVSYEIDTEVPVSYMEKLLGFIQKKYLLPQKERFKGVARKKSETGSVLAYSVADAQGRALVQVEVNCAQSRRSERSHPSTSR